MLSIVHGATGAYLGTVCPQPLVYIPGAILMHFVEDAVPHWDIGTGMHSGQRRKMTAFLLEIIDLVATVALVFFLFQKTIPTSWAEVNWAAWLGAAAGIAVDVAEFPNSFLEVKPAPLKPGMKLHHHVHRSVKSPFWGLLPQAIVLASLIYLVLFALPAA